MITSLRRLHLATALAGILLLWPALAATAAAKEPLGERPFPQRFGLRLSYYFISKADTDMAVLSSKQIGTGFSFADDLGGDDSATIPRIDGYYRIDGRHRLDFGYHRLVRDGRDLLEVELDIGDETFAVGEDLVSRIEFEMLEIGYGYSFYHSAEVELIFTAGLNFTSYRFDYSRADGSKSGSSRASGPLPMFGLDMEYTINPKWSIHYLAEAFFFETPGNIEGALQNYALDARYRVARQLVLGAGLIRYGTDLKSRDVDWRGRISDTNQGLLLSATLVF